MALQIGSHTANGRRGQHGKLGRVRITCFVGDFEAVPAFSEVHTFTHLRTLVFPFALSTDKEGQSLDCRAADTDGGFWLNIAWRVIRCRLKKPWKEESLYLLKKKKKSRKASVDEQWVSPL